MMYTLLPDSSPFLPCTLVSIIGSKQQEQDVHTTVQKLNEVNLINRSMRGSIPRTSSGVTK